MTKRVSLKDTIDALLLANKKLIFQDEEKEKRARELLIANKELLFQTTEKAKRADELIIANKELVFQNAEKAKRADELIIANKELVFQNAEKAKRADELIIANKELVFQNEEKAKRAEELLIANKELAFQNVEKEKRAQELLIANEELVFQNLEKERRAVELTTANIELKAAEEAIRTLNNDIQKLNENLEKKVLERTQQLEYSNKELESFSYSVSHDLRSPLRAIEGYAMMLEEEYVNSFDEEGRRLLTVVQENAKRMGVLIDDLLEFSRLGRKEIRRSMIDMNELAGTALRELNAAQAIHAEIKIDKLHSIVGDSSIVKQVWINLLSNAIKYSATTQLPVIEVKSVKLAGMVQYSVADNGVGFEMKYADKLFGVFQRLHDAEDFEGTGVGLALVDRIIKRHGGSVWAESEVGKGATFYFNLPDKK